MKCIYTQCWTQVSDRLLLKHPLVNALGGWTLTRNHSTHYLRPGPGLVVDHNPMVQIASATLTSLLYVSLFHVYLSCNVASIVVSRDTWYSSIGDDTGPFTEEKGVVGIIYHIHPMHAVGSDSI